MSGARRVAAAGLWAAALSGVPSTAWAAARRTDPLAATRAAGTMLLPGDSRPSRLLPTAAAAHLALSLGWTAVLDAALQRRSAASPGTAAGAGALAGLGIAVLDLGLAHATRGPRLAAVRALPVGPQIADHVAFGIIAAVCLTRPR